MSTKDGVAVTSAIEDLRYRIVSGQLSAGEQVRQEETANRLNLSRAPIREALHVLADQGLLEHRVHVGYFVKKRSTSELRQIYLMLEFLETKVMETLTEPSNKIIGHLQSLNDEMATYVAADDWSPMVDLNRRFHFEVFRLSPLDVVIEELERLWTIAAPYISQKYATQEMRQRTVDEHTALIGALSPLDLDRAITVLAEHRSQRASGR
ncbi:MAG: GntR family transcriptional regulator [Acidimicrobiales bacterium]